MPEAAKRWRSIVAASPGSPKSSLGIVTIFFGIILLSNPIQAALGLPVTLGILLIFGGIFLIIAAFRLRSA